MPELPRKRSAADDAADFLTAPDGPRTVRPAAITGGATLVLLRAAGGALWITNFFVAWPQVAVESDLTGSEQSVLLAFIAAFEIAWIVLLILLGVLVIRGSNTARMLVMIGSSLSIIASATGYFTAGEEITMRTTLLTLSLDILILLALSSREARAWSRGRSDRRRRGA